VVALTEKKGEEIVQIEVADRFYGWFLLNLRYTQGARIKMEIE